MQLNVAAVAQNAADIVAQFEGHPEFAEFKAASLNYSDDWQCFTGFPVVSEWNLERDAEPLFVEGLRALAIKAAVFHATADEKAAEVPIAVPVDEMTHAMIAQSQLLQKIAGHCGTLIIHQTDQEHTDYHAGSITHALYVAAFGEEPPARYWLDHHEVTARREHLATLYARIGMGRSGREHSIDFAAVAA